MPPTVSDPAVAKALYGKYTVTRNDGKDGPGQKHHGCSYFVLDVDHDPHAHAALSLHNALLDAMREGVYTYGFLRR